MTIIVETKEETIIEEVEGILRTGTKTVIEVTAEIRDKIEEINNSKTASEVLLSHNNLPKSLLKIPLISRNQMKN